MQITAELLDEAAKGNVYCTSLFRDDLCYYCNVIDKKDIKAKYYYYYSKQHEIECNLIISFCSKKCREHIVISPLIKLTEKDVFYIKINANNT